MHLVENGDSVRTFDVNVGSVLQQQCGKVGLAEVEGTVQSRLTALHQRLGVQVTSAVDEAR